MMNILRRGSHTHVSLYSPFRKLFFDQACLSVPVNTLIPPSTPPHNFSQTDFSVISGLLRNPAISSGPSLESELNQTGVEPEPALLLAVFEHFDHSPKLLHTLFRWAESKPEFKCSAALFNCMIKVLAKAKEFDSAWCLLLDKIGGHEAPDFVSKDTFVILIRRYARAGMVHYIWLWKKKWFFLALFRI